MAFLGMKAKPRAEAPGTDARRVQGRTALRSQGATCPLGRLDGDVEAEDRTANHQDARDGSGDLGGIGRAIEGVGGCGLGHGIADREQGQGGSGDDAVANGHGVSFSVENVPEFPRKVRGNNRGEGHPPQLLRLLQSERG